MKYDDKRQTHLIEKGEKWQRDRQDCISLYSKDIRRISTNPQKVGDSTRYIKLTLTVSKFKN